MNVILRTVFDKPEMLHLSLKYEQQAREYFDDDYLTIFVIDAGANPRCFDVIKNYPFKAIVVERPFRHFVCANAMEGLKLASRYTDDYVINMEDDVILHKTYFEFVHHANNLIKDNTYSVITTWGYSVDGDPSVLKKVRYSCGPGTVINKKFFIDYMLEYANSDYYTGWIPTINKVNELNENNPNAIYSVKNGNPHSHLDWDGLMNRLVDYAYYIKGLHSYASMCYRLLHIGFYGFNRHGKYPKGIDSLEDKIAFLESNIFNPEVLMRLDGTYKDYYNFDPRLDSWDGILNLEV